MGVFSKLMNALLIVLFVGLTTAAPVFTSQNAACTAAHKYCCNVPSGQRCAGGSCVNSNYECCDCQTGKVEPHGGANTSPNGACQVGGSDLCSCSQLIAKHIIKSFNDCPQEAAVAACKD